MCFNKSSSSQSQATKVNDYRVGAENGGIAIGSQASANIRIGSDDVAIASLENQRALSDLAIDTAFESTNNALRTGVDFVAGALSEFLNKSDAQLQRANSNVTASRQFAADLIADNTETSDERLIKIVRYGMGAAVIAITIQSGALNQLIGAFK